MSAIGVQQAQAIPVEHGIDPNADADNLMALLQARGWRVSVEQALGRGRGQVPQWNGQATLAAPPGSAVSLRATHTSARGVNQREVLLRMLAKVLEKEGEA